MIPNFKTSSYMWSSTAVPPPTAAFICEAGTKSRWKQTPSRSRLATTWAAYTVSWPLRLSNPANLENGRASISLFSVDGSPWSKTAKPSSTTRKFPVAPVARSTASKNCQGRSIFKEVKKGMSSIAVSSSHLGRNSTHQRSPVRPMTHFLRDILRQPKELQRTIDFLLGVGRPVLDAATGAIRGARHVYLTGIGSSWHAALCAGTLFNLAGNPVYLYDAAELLEFAEFPSNAVVIVISRSGRSVEIVKLLAKVRERGAIVIAITIELDHAISVNTYSTLAAAAGILASAAVGTWGASLAATLSASFAKTGAAISGWQSQLEDTTWLARGGTTYFLARGCSTGSCQEARLLWEEGVKSPATAMNTGSFRHGPQEMVTAGARFGIWIDAERMRGQDLAVARDLRKLGAAVMLIGQNAPQDAGDLVFQLPSVPPGWQFLIDIIPGQLAAEKLARLSGVDSDTFRYCSFIVEDEYGLLPPENGSPNEKT